jgi:phenylacetate-coenzyme A ligase PaaK-like adenylate-forming protein
LNNFRNINYNLIKNQVFKVDDSSFEETALKVFYYQYENNLVYKRFVDLISKKEIRDFNEIPFIPIETFKKHQLICGDINLDNIIEFKSSGTTGLNRSTHFVKDISLYEKSIELNYKRFIGGLGDYHILALLPSYFESGDSSLIYMVNFLINNSKSKHSGFYLKNFEELYEKIQSIEKSGEKALLIGVSYALLDFSELYKMDLKNTIIMETGGMKGRRKEIIREDLHSRLKSAFGVSNIFSEYGMTELLSQSYSVGDGIFISPPWKRILISDTNDPNELLDYGQTGAIDIIDLANINSCSFLKTKDLGKKFSDGSFEVIGRFDNSDIRGCNLLL